MTYTILIEEEAFPNSIRVHTTKTSVSVHGVEVERFYLWSNKDAATVQTVLNALADVGATSYVCR